VVEDTIDDHPQAAGVGLRFDEPAYLRMRAMFDARGIAMPESNRRQAMLPATSRTLENQMGTAPGFVTPLVVDGRTVEVWSFPGVPREYEHLRDDHLLPSLRARRSSARSLSVMVPPPAPPLKLGWVSMGS
jgi:molybdopterin-biosynthesis enzyme MoeA-like protein